MSVVTGVDLTSQQRCVPGGHLVVEVKMSSLHIPRCATAPNQIKKM